MNPIIAGTTCLTIGMIWLFLWNSYKSRQHIESREHIELVLKSTGIGWFVPAFIVLNLLIYWFNHKKWPSEGWEISKYILLSGFIVAELGNWWLQKQIRPDRILLVEGEILYLGYRISRLKTRAIREIKLNGWTEQIILNAKWPFYFSKNRISRADLDRLLAFLWSETGEQIKISENLMMETGGDVNENRKA